MFGKTAYTNNFIPISITPTNYAVTCTLYSWTESASHILKSGAELYTDHDFSQQQPNIKLQLNTNEVLQTQHFLFSESVRPALWPTQLPIKYVPGNFPGVKRLGCKVDHSTLYSAEVQSK
jgi:hypothetical protein